MPGFFRIAGASVLVFPFMEMKPRFLAVLFFCGAVCVLSPGCATGRKKVPPPLHRQVGVIAFVNEAERIVLIDTGGVAAPEPGVALKSFTGGRESGVLSVSRERRVPFVTADIVQGAPKIVHE